MALVIVMQGASTNEVGVALIGAVIAGALQRALSRDAAVLKLQRSDAELRLLVISKYAAPQVQQWLDERLAWGEVITRLHEQRGEA